MSALVQSLEHDLQSHHTLPELRVALFGVERLVPRGADEGLMKAWLSAPIAGRPLYQRLLEPMVGLPVREVLVVTGPVGRMLVALLNQDPVFGLEVTEVEAPPLWGYDDAMTLMLPGSGLLELDLRHLVRRMAASSSTGGTCKIRLGDGLYAHVLAADRNRIASASQGGEQADITYDARGRLRKVDCAQGLIGAARAAIDRRDRPWAWQGEWQGGVLCGGGATVSPLAELDLSSGLGSESAVGALTHVEHGVRLGPGAVIGRQSYICADALITNSVVLDDTFIKPNERIQGAVRWRNRELR